MQEAQSLQTHLGKIVRVNSGEHAEAAAAEAARVPRTGWRDHLPILRLALVMLVFDFSAYLTEALITYCNGIRKSSANNRGRSLRDAVFGKIDDQVELGEVHSADRLGGLLGREWDATLGHHGAGAVRNATSWDYACTVGLDHIAAEVTREGLRHLTAARICQTNEEYPCRAFLQSCE